MDNKELPQVTPSHFEASVRFVPDAIAIIWDIAAFTTFFNRPDAVRFVPLVLNELAAAVSTSWAGGNTYWNAQSNPTETKTQPLRNLSLLQRKFLGDGELIIMECLASIEESSVAAFLNRLWNINAFYTEIRDRLVDQVPLQLPPGVRFGVARGSLVELKNTGTPGTEYIGVCINLASRLSRFCSGLNFVASARVLSSTELLTKHKYARMVAKNLRGFASGSEEVVVDAKSLKLLSDNERKKLFLERGASPAR